MMLKFDHDQTDSHRLINKRFGVEDCWSYISGHFKLPRKRSKTSAGEFNRPITKNDRVAKLFIYIFSANPNTCTICTVWYIITCTSIRVYRTIEECWETDGCPLLISGMITVTGVLRHAESKSGLNSGLALLLHGGSVTILS